MNKIFAVLLCASVAASASANPSVGSDAGRSFESGSTSSMKRDKSLSADKARGDRQTITKSRERAHEQSQTESNSESRGRSFEKSKSSEVSLNINGILLQQFVKRYERTAEGEGMAGAYFSACKPISTALSDYPVWSFDQGKVTGRTEAMYGNGNGMIASRGDGVVVLYVDSNDTYIRRYAQCRMTASAWLSHAGDLANRTSPKSEQEVVKIIQEVFHQMDLDGELFIQIRQQSRDDWDQQAYCSQWLGDYKDFTEPDMDCSVFQFKGRDMYVKNRKTLSDDSIDGRSFTISLSGSESDSYRVENSSTSDDSVSRSARMSDSDERFRERKNTATLSKSKSSEASTSTKLDRGSKAGVNSTPGE
ncbi:MAG: hypothetical protein AB1540_15235 [Bdellovibrionota bacterium]